MMMNYKLNVGRVCVQRNSELVQNILHEVHSGIMSIHSGSKKMYNDLKKMYWWPGMKEDIFEFLSKCLICQKVKAKHQPVTISEWKWERITMALVSRLPLPPKKEDAIWVIIDRLTKRSGVGLKLCKVKGYQGGIRGVICGDFQGIWSVRRVVALWDFKPNLPFSSFNICSFFIICWPNITVVNPFLRRSTAKALTIGVVKCERLGGVTLSFSKRPVSRKAKTSAFEASRACDCSCGKPSPQSWAIDCKGHHERPRALGLLWAMLGQNEPCGPNGHMVPTRNKSTISGKLLNWAITFI
ncbi:integrase [Gossypium australe]|uniref:Integrase n=1 Tax=Gossypium australe TaxID=47621 RepID=A0A5B6X4U5_9ROSI|nr:integrase [Gossypium australe]